MKNVINVSIAGIAFKLEEEAFTRLDSYLNTIRDYYGDSPDGEEILNDIEARIAEVILTQQEASTVVPTSLINSTLDRLGAPEIISEGAPGKSAPQKEEAKTVNSGKSIPHRLYRNPEGAKLGGVCSGLASYFNIDPVIVRLLFATPLILLIFMSITSWGWWGGRINSFLTGPLTTSFILYMILWIVIPKAKTPLQKMEMKGEKITKDSLEQTFREEFQSRSNDPQNIELRAKNERSASVFSEVISIIGKILLFFVKAFVAIIGFAFAMAIVGILTGIVFIVIGGAGAIDGFTAPSTVLISIIALVAILIPLGLAVYGILKLLFNFNHSKPFVSTLLVIWVLTLVFGTVIFIKDFDNIYFDRGISIGWSSDEGGWRGNRTRSGERAIAHTERWEEEGHNTTHALSIAGDSLFIAPMDSVRLPDNLTVKLRHDSREFETPTIVVRKTYKDYSPTGSQEYIALIEVDHTVRNDTLYLKAVIPDIPQVKGERVQVDIYLPAQKEVVVLKGINYNEYYNR